MKMHAIIATVKPQNSPPVPPSVTANSRFLSQFVSVLSLSSGVHGASVRKEKLPCTDEDSAEAENWDEAEIALVTV